MRDPYTVLGVRRDAGAEDIKRAYRRLAKELHPDLHPGDGKVEQRFKEVAQAYAILGDPDKRKRFDSGRIDANGQETGWPGGGARQDARRGRGAAYRSFDFGQDVDVEDILSDLFGARGGARRTRRRGADVSYSAPISFLDAAVGAKRRIRLSDGKVLDMTIPPGTADRQTLRLKGQGMPGAHGGAPGDAYVEVHVQPHAFFERKDNDVHLELPVTLPEAVLGATVTVPTVHGKVSMRIPPGSNTGATLRLKGKGIVDRKSGVKGDQYVKLTVTLPDAPDTDLNEFAERWGKRHKYDPRRKAGMA